MRPEELQQLKSKAMMNLVAFRHLVLATDPGTEVMPAEYHYEWSDLLLKGTTNTVIQGYRESAKTQYVLRSYLLYCLAFPSKERDYIVLIKNNATLASAKLREIEREYSNNPIISANKIEIHEESGNAFAVDALSPEGEKISMRIEAYGKGASIRGLADIDRRPKIVIIDDPQDVEDAKSETVTENDWNWFLSDVKFLGQKTRIFLIGNNLGERSIVERTFIKAKELTFQAHKVPIIMNGVSAWPSKYTLGEINKSKEDYRALGKLDIWYREKMCEAISDETRTFDRNDFRYYSPELAHQISQTCNIFIAVDPAISEDKNADYTAIMVVGVNPENHWFILDCVYGRLDPTQTIDHIFALVRRWRPRVVGIEKVAYQRALSHFIMKEMPSKDLFFPIQELVADKQKELRIRGLQPRFKAKTVWMPVQAAWLTELETELLMFPKAMNDDLVDALAYIEQIEYAKTKLERQRLEFANAGISPEFANTGQKYDPLK